MSLVTLHESALYRTMRRALLHSTNNEELADKALDAIIEAHPHLSEVWEQNTCRACKAILTPLDRAEEHPYCEYCRSDVDPHEYYEHNLQKYGGE